MAMHQQHSQEMCAALDEGQRRAAEDIFNAIDSDGSGMLSGAEVDSFFSEDGQPKPRSLRLLDPNGDGKVTWSEGEACWLKLANLEEGSKVDGILKLLKEISDRRVKEKEGCNTWWKCTSEDGDQYFEKSDGSKETAWDLPEGATVLDDASGLLADPLLDDVLGSSEAVHHHPPGLEQKTDGTKRKMLFDGYNMMVEWMDEHRTALADKDEAIASLRRQLVENDRTALAQRAAGWTVALSAAFLTFVFSSKAPSSLLLS
jgi:hypothetical protein